MLKKALEQPDLFVFHKGTPVKLDVSGIPDPGEKAKAEESLTKKLKDLGCPIDPAGQVSIVASVEGPKDREITYMHSGTYHVQEYITWLKIVYEGQTLWETHYTNIPGILSLKQGRERRRQVSARRSQARLCPVQNAVLPEFLQKPSDKTGAGAEQTLGTTQLTTQGFRAKGNPQGVHFKRRK